MILCLHNEMNSFKVLFLGSSVLNTNNSMGINVQLLSTHAKTKADATNLAIQTEREIFINSLIV